MKKFYIYNKRAKKYFRGPQGGMTKNINEAHLYSKKEIDSFSNSHIKSSPILKIIEVGVEVKGLPYWKENAEEDYITTPISVLRYISELEQEIKSKNNV